MHLCKMTLQVLKLYQRHKVIIRESFLTSPKILSDLFYLPNLKQVSISPVNQNSDVPRPSKSNQFGGPFQGVFKFFNSMY